MAQPLTASIIVNNFNYGRFVGDALTSALRLSYPHTEVFVVDDGSTDESRDVIAGYEHRVVTILKPNGGQASALNLAFPMTRGDVIYVLDSDDGLEPEAVERSIGLFEDPAVVKVHWPMRLIDQRGEATGVVRPKHLVTGNLRARAIEIGPANHQSPPTSGNAWSRALMQELFPVHEQDFKNDVDSYLMAMAPLIGNVAAVDEPLSRYRVHGSNLSSQLGAQRRLQQWETRAPYMQAYLARDGVEVSIDQWRERNGFVQRLRSVLATIREIDAVVPIHEPLILIASELFVSSDFASGRTVYSLAAGDWDQSDIDERALQLTERHAQHGVTYLAIAGRKFRRSGQLSQFVERVREELDVILENERILICCLAPARARSGAKGSEITPSTALPNAPAGSKK